MRYNSLLWIILLTLCYHVSFVHGTQGEEYVIIHVAREQRRKVQEKMVSCSVSCTIKFASERTLLELASQNPTAVIMFDNSRIGPKIHEMLLKLEEQGKQLVVDARHEAPKCRLEPYQACLKHFGIISMHPSSLVRTSYAPLLYPREAFLLPMIKETKPTVGVFISSPCEEKDESDYKDFGKIVRGRWLRGLKKYFKVSHYSNSCKNAIALPLDKMNGWLNRNHNLMRDVSKIAVSSLHKFTLSIENKIDDGYITEKFYQGFLNRNIPIYLGPPSAKYYAPGEHSFIDLNEFMSVPQLADYLKYLLRNETAYAEYFTWKKNPREEFWGMWNIADYCGKMDSEEAWVALLETVQRNMSGWDPQILNAIHDMLQAYKGGHKVIPDACTETWEGSKECRLCKAVAQQKQPRRLQNLTEQFSFGPFNSDYFKTSDQFQIGLNGFVGAVLVLLFLIAGKRVRANIT